MDISSRDPHVDSYPLNFKGETEKQDHSSLKKLAHNYSPRVVLLFPQFSAN